MLRPRVIPCLLLKGDGLVKTVGFESENYIGDPMNAIRIFNDLEADELVFLDIEASKKGDLISVDFVKKVGEEAFMPFAVGGGIRNTEDIKKLLKSGAEKVVINTNLVENPNLIKETSDIFGSQSIIASIDAKRTLNGNYKVFTFGGTKETDKNPVEVAKEAEKQGAGEILITSIDKDGEMGGYDLELIKMVSESVEIPVIACGGAGNLEDFVIAIKKGDASAVAAGSLFVYSGKEKGILINYPEKDELEEIFNR